MDENSTEPELYPLDPDVGMAPEPETVEETVTGDVDPAGELGTEGLGEDEDGNPVTQAEGRPAPLEAWSDEDPEFVDLLSLEEAETQEDAPDEDLPVEAPEESEEDEDTPVTDQGVARWVQYELWGRNVSLGEGWTRYAVADFAGGIEAEVDDLTAGTNLQLRIRLVDNLGRFSKWSAAIQVSLPSDFTPPPEPTAPSVSDNNGIIVTRWDGQLMGETPADMSHVLHYVQQMHPAGNPDGPAGDPQLISEFRRQGRHTSGAFADRVEHRAWFSAVDTTGNESPRSEYAYFTPTAPVDAQRIDDELEAINGEGGRLPALEQALSEGFSARDQTITEIQQAAITNAESAQEEYDRLQALADDARSKAEDIETAQGLTAAEVADLRTDASAAQAAADAADARAEEARLAALAAQHAAGSAQTTADAAMSSANAKSRIYSSTAAPSGTADEGDLWYRWSSTGTDRRLLGIWVRESNTWRSMGTLDATLIPLLDIGAGTFGSLAGDRLLADSVGAREVNTSDLAADVARMNQLWTGLAMIAEAQIDSLLGNSAKFKIIEGAAIIGGSIRTSSASGDGVTVDEGTISYYDIFTNNTRSHVSPYVEFGTGQVEGERPKIAAGPGGTGLVLSAGNDLNGSGASLNPIIMHGQLLTDRVTLREDARFTPHSIMLSNTAGAQLSGIRTDGPRTILVGRVSDGHGPQDMYVHCHFDAGLYGSTDAEMRGTYTWGSPASAGTRRTVPTAESNWWSQARAFSCNIVNSDASHFRFRVKQTEGGGNSAIAIAAIAWWN
ncbi:hypothetical protein [Nesterenkonia jeotgali]|uniref:Fibronectin type-III domain-containing protein n=1 Tax=Nesterenkonia jeotgali TaxID=317018 RepID=A0A0W8IG81_9MICC|nr:hypothetical protein [Nesterenkonia jeotgali]KUG58989.1 hypothetical protein AVL63_02910 [Nesterenkonia jeotgali]